jgi:hypothetical protein
MELQAFAVLLCPRDHTGGVERSAKVKFKIAVSAAGWPAAFEVGARLIFECPMVF